MKNLKHMALIALAIVVMATFCSAVGFGAAFMAVKHGAAFGWLLVFVIIGAVLLIDWKGNKDGII